MCQYRLRGRYRAIKFQLHALVICANILHNIFWIWTASDSASVLVYRCCSSTMSFQASYSCCNGFCAQCWKALPVHHVREEICGLPDPCVYSFSVWQHSGWLTAGPWRPDRWRSYMATRVKLRDCTAGSWPQLKEKKTRDWKTDWQTKRERDIETKAGKTHRKGKEILN